MGKKISRREMIHHSALLVGSVCMCHQAMGATEFKSTCCNTPNLEAESLEIGEKSIIVDLTKAPTLSEVGTAAFIINKEKSLDIIVVRAEEEKYFVLSRLCTHGRQVLSYVRKRGVLQCNSFNHSIFALNGQVVKGPAPEPLKSYPVTYSQGKLEITI